MARIRAPTPIGSIRNHIFEVHHVSLFAFTLSFPFLSRICCSSSILFFSLFFARHFYRQVKSSTTLMVVDFLLVPRPTTIIGQLILIECWHVLNMLSSTNSNEIQRRCSQHYASKLVNLPLAALLKSGCQFYNVM